MRNMVLDEIDLKIINELKKDSRIPVIKLAEKIGITPPTVYRRLKKLTEEGIIQGYTIKVDESKVENVIYAFIGLETPFPEKIANKLKEMPEVVEVFITSGPQNIILKVKAKDISSLNDVLRKFEKMNHIIRCQVSIVLNNIKS